MATTNLHGIFPAVVTPFDENENFVPAAFERLLARLYAAGIDGLYVNGYTGEGFLQPVEQRKRVAEVALHSTPKGKSVIVHVGANRTADAVELARHAATIGVQAISSLLPLGPYSPAEIRAHYQALAMASDLPILVYYFPEFSTAIQGIQQILELLDLPKVIGVKFSDFDLYKLSLLRKKECVLFNGRDEVLAAGLLMGADGGIGSFYNLIPECFVELFQLAQQSRWDEARQIQSRINELIEISLRFPMLAAVKAILSWQGLDCGRPLPPRRSLTEEEARCLQGLLRDSSFGYLVSEAAEQR